MSFFSISIEFAISLIGFLFAAFAISKSLGYVAILPPYTHKISLKYT